MSAQLRKALGEAVPWWERNSQEEGGEFKEIKIAPTEKYIRRARVATDIGNQDLAGPSPSSLLPQFQHEWMRSTLSTLGP